MAGGDSGLPDTSPTADPGADIGGDATGASGTNDDGGTIAGQLGGSTVHRSHQVSPAATGWFARLAARDCAGVVGGSGDEAVLVRALRAVCPAVVRGGRPDWAAAAADYRKLGVDVSGGDCAESAGYALLTRLLALHRAHPSAVFHVTDSSPGEQCEAGT